jgi:hypothetical protein
MPAYQFYNPAPVFFDLLGTQIAANGTLEFYNAGGTTTPRDTWSDSDLSPSSLNTNPIELGPDARSPVPIFCDGDYTVVLKNSLGAVIATNQLISGLAAGASIPALQTGEYLTNDGSSLSWQPILQLPDPAGSTAHYLTTDGANFIWAPIPTAPVIPDLQIVVEDDATPKFQAGTSAENTKFLIQFGQATAPATGNKGTSVGITFATPFVKLAHVAVTVNIAAATPSGALVDNSVTGYTFMGASTGATVNFNVSDDDNNSSWKISNDIDFTYAAFGYIEVAPP